MAQWFTRPVDEIRGVPLDKTEYAPHVDAAGRVYRFGREHGTFEECDEYIRRHLASPLPRDAHDDWVVREREWRRSAAGQWSGPVPTYWSSCWEDEDGDEAGELVRWRPWLQEPGSASSVVGVGFGSRGECDAFIDEHLSPPL